MKLRIKDNTLRLRLGQSEVDQLIQQGRIRAEMPLPYPRSQSLIYELAMGEGSTIEVAFSGMKLIIRVPKDQVFEWIETDRVGISSSIDAGDDKSLHITIEKDFQCLIAREGEDDSDSFPNPNT